MKINQIRSIYFFCSFPCCLLLYSFVWWLLFDLPVFSFLIPTFFMASQAGANFCASRISTYASYCSNFPYPTSCRAESFSPYDCIWVAGPIGSHCVSLNSPYAGYCSNFRYPTSCRAESFSPYDCIWVNWTNILSGGCCEAFYIYVDGF